MRKLSDFSSDMMTVPELFLNGQFEVSSIAAPVETTTISSDAAALSLETLVEQGYHTPNFTTDPSPQVDSSASYSSGNIREIEMGMTECCACSSCSNLLDVDLVDGAAGSGLAGLMQGSAGYDIPTLDFGAEMGSSLTFTLTDTGGVGAGTDAEAGFLAAVALWTSFLGDAVDVRLDVGFSSLGAGILGQAGSDTAVVSYAAFRAALIADGTSADDATAIANLQAGPALNFTTNNGAGTFIQDNDGSANNLFLSVNTATLKAVGITTDANGNPVDDGVSADASITFNSDFTFDFDPTDGIDAGAIDFVGVAFHEIGHALGFVSGVDTVDFFTGSGPNAPFDLNGFAIFSALDLFRYSTNTNTNFPGALDLSTGGTTFFSIDGGTTNLGGFSTGSFNGDGRQASHWKDNLGLGILDPTSAPAGSANVITGLDIRAFDVIGWDLIGADDAVNLYDDDGFLIASFTTLQAAESAASNGYRIAADAGTYAANPESVTTALNDLTFSLTPGVTPTITMIGAAADLTLEGSGGGNVQGNALANVITGNDGNNIINGNSGADILSGGAGNDTLRGQGDDDTVDGGAGNDTVLGGLGNDTLGGDAGDDFMNGQGGDDIINGGDGVDTLLGASGNDTLNGDGGNDNINGNGGNDTINGGDGSDTLNGAVGFDIINGGQGADTISGGNQNDTLNGDIGNDTINGDAGNDIIDGGANNDVLNGASGADVINGGTGNDTLSGDAGGDDLFGDAGADTLNGGGGNDDLNGGAGADTFVANLGFRTDRIQDFENGTDQIDFSGNSLANDFADVMAAASQAGTSVRIELNANNILILEGFNLADIDASDFIF